MGHIFDLESPALHVGMPRTRPRHRPSVSDERRSTVQHSECGIPDPESIVRQKYQAQYLRRLRKHGSTIEKETLLIPIAVANGVWREASTWLGEMLPREWIVDLAVRPEVIYAHNPQFRKLLRGRGNSGRDWLWAFARHWLSGLLFEHRPSLAARMPAGYQSGHPLPSAVP